MADIKIKPIHLSISVNDLDESLKWYKEHLGFELVFRMYLRSHRAQLAFVRNGDFEIEMFRHDDTSPVPPERLDPHEDQKIQGTKHIAFLTDDVDELAKQLASEGVEIVTGPKIMECKEAGVREKICFIHDCNGICIEFIQRKNMASGE
ncbi:MAG: VOC family protein [Lachnospiraceae bacterium]|nr:VOC family protein [Lachnospiraceae bacterium]